MIILGINSATARASVCVVKNAIKKIAKTTTDKIRQDEARVADLHHVLFAKSWESNRDEAEKILPAVLSGLKVLKNEKPDRIFVVRGPGAFTGLRIGVTIANTLASVLGVKVSSIDTFDFLRARIPDEKRKKTALILKAGGEYAAVLLPGKKTPHRIDKDELAGYLKRHPSLKFAMGDMSVVEKKTFYLPDGMKWIGENELADLAEVIMKSAVKMKSQKMVAPKYLLPPKITKSKKPDFTR
jgi:tRNA threonylcarbamoyl adenosine modification protein YeaZ